MAIHRRSLPFPLLLAVLLILPSDSSSYRTPFVESLIRTLPGTSTHSKPDCEKHARNHKYCNSWKYSVETNNAGNWKTIPAKCESFVADYMNGPRYHSDSKVVASYSLAFAKEVFTGDGKDAWVFDVDETLLSNLQYYAENGYGSELFNETKWDEWVVMSAAKAVPANLELYNKLKALGFKIMILTGRGEAQREITQKNLESAGYSGWVKLILRGDDDGDKTAVEYKSGKRAMLESEGYKIRGSTGDQWSDLLGTPSAQRSFKQPNPMYFIA